MSALCSALRALSSVLLQACRCFLCAQCRHHHRVIRAAVFFINLNSDTITRFENSSSAGHPRLGMHYPSCRLSHFPHPTPPQIHPSHRRGVFASKCGGQLNTHAHRGASNYWFGFHPLEPRTARKLHSCRRDTSSGSWHATPRRHNDQDLSVVVLCRLGRSSPRSQAPLSPSSDPTPASPGLGAGVRKATWGAEFLADF